MKNRSLPTDTLLPHVLYHDVPRAVAWLTALGFTEHYRYGEPVSGVQMRFGDACLMLKAVPSPADGTARTHYLTVFVDDVDAHFEKARDTGAKVIEVVNETCYGERQYVVQDFEGHTWLFSQHVKDLNPDEWGATIARS